MTDEKSKKDEHSKKTDPKKEEIKATIAEDHLEISILKEQIKTLQTELDTAKQKNIELTNISNELTNVSKRALADLQNFKKRVDDDKKNFIDFANSSLILEILPTLDNLGRALKNVPQELKDNHLVKGIEQIEKGLWTVLNKFGLKEIPTENQTFDANIHEALMEVQGEKGKIIEEVEKGYKLGEKILRPAKVKVGSDEIQNS